MRRMTRASFFVALFSLLSLLMVGCSKPKPPTIKPDKTQITSVKPKGVTVRVTLDVHNPNDFALTVRSVKATILLGGQTKLGPVDKPHGVSLPANVSTKVDFDLEASWELAAELAGLATLGPTIPYEVDGTVNVGGDRLNLDLPFKIKGQVSQAQLIAAGLKGIPSIPGLPNLPIPR